LAILIRLLGDFDLAEEAMHVAFAAARNAQEQYARLLQVLRLSVSDTILCIILHYSSLIVR
jgi:hypothetical protein